MSSRVLSGLSVAVFLLGSRGLANPLYSIPVSNFSFESPSCGSVGPAVCSPAGWALTGISGALLPASTAWDSIPDGTQVAFANAGALTQNLAVTIVPDATYTLSVWVSRRSTAGQSFLPEIELLGGSTALFTMNNVTPGGAAPTLNTDGTYNWQDWTMTYTAPSSGAIIGQALSISLGSDGAQTNFDNVSAQTSASPEPGMFLLIGGGLMGLGLWRRFAK